MSISFPGAEGILRQEILARLEEAGRNGVEESPLGEQVAGSPEELPGTLRRLEREGKAVEMDGRWFAPGHADWEVGSVERLEEGDALFRPVLGPWPAPGAGRAHFLHPQAQPEAGARRRYRGGAPARQGAPVGRPAARGDGRQGPGVAPRHAGRLAGDGRTGAALADSVRSQGVAGAAGGGRGGGARRRLCGGGGRPHRPRPPGARARGAGRPRGAGGGRAWWCCATTASRTSSCGTVLAAAAAFPPIRGRRTGRGARICGGR